MSQAKLAVALLLIGPFAAKNQEIYKDDPRMLAKFQDLSLDDLVIGEVTKHNGVHTARISSPTRNFSGAAQKWRPVTIHSDKVVALTSDEILESKEAAQAIVEGGVFSYLAEDGEAKHIIVVGEGSEGDVGQLAIDTLIASLKYAIPGSQITLGDGTGTILVTDDFITGEIEYVVAATPVDQLEESEPLDL